MARTVTQNETSATDYYLYDGLGCVMALGNAGFTITQTLEYDVWGSQRAGQGTSSNALKYVGQLGHPSDDDTGLVYMRARYYDPDVGRFVSEDPAGDGDNWFVYADSDPVNAVDPDGQSIVSWVKKMMRAWALGRHISRRPVDRDQPWKSRPGISRRQKPGGGGGGDAGGAGGAGGMGYTSLEAYAQQEPEDFVDIFRELGGL